MVSDSSRRTAEVAVRILGGEKAGDIRLAPTEYAAPKFDWRQLQRWGISEQLLPPGSSEWLPGLVPGGTRPSMSAVHSA